MFQEMMCANGSSGGVQVKSETGITVGSSPTQQNVGFQPKKLYVCMQYGSQYMWYLIYDEELGLNTSVLKGSGNLQITSATTYITLNSAGFTIYAVNAGWVSSSSNIYTYIASE